MHRLPQLNSFSRFVSICSSSWSSLYKSLHLKYTCVSPQWQEIFVAIVHGLHGFGWHLCSHGWTQPGAALGRLHISIHSSQDLSCYRKEKILKHGKKWCKTLLFKYAVKYTNHHWSFIFDWVAHFFAFMIATLQCTATYATTWIWFRIPARPWYGFMTTNAFNRHFNFTFWMRKFHEFIFFHLNIPWTSRFIALIGYQNLNRIMTSSCTWMDAIGCIIF